MKIRFTLKAWMIVALIIKTPVLGMEGLGLLTNHTSHSSISKMSFEIGHDNWKERSESILLETQGSELTQSELLDQLYIKMIPSVKESLESYLSGNTSLELIQEMIVTSSNRLILATLYRVLKEVISAYTPGTSEHEKLKILSHNLIETILAYPESEKEKKVYDSVLHDFMPTSSDNYFTPFNLRWNWEKRMARSAISIWNAITYPDSALFEKLDFLSYGLFKKEVSDPSLFDLSAYQNTLQEVKKRRFFIKLPTPEIGLLRLFPLCIKEH